MRLGGGAYVPRDFPPGEQPREPRRHERLKDLAIEALCKSKSKSWFDVNERLQKALANSRIQQDGLSEVLTCMVVSCYTVAEFLPPEHAMQELRFTFSLFSDDQLKRIIAAV